MKATTQLLYAFVISIVFLALHVVMAYFKLGDIANLVFSLGLMTLSQVVAFILLKHHLKGKPLKFHAIFLLLALTQGCSVIFLALNSAYNPMAEFAPLNYTEILVSLTIFAVLFPVVVTTAIWFGVVRKRHRLMNDQ